MIRKTDRLSAVFKTNEGLVEVFRNLSPALRGLGSPEVRKVMSSLMTVEQAARVSGLDPDELVLRLQHGEDPLEARTGDPSAEDALMKTELPRDLAAVPEELIVELDVRDDLRSGREPFSRIIAARGQVPDGGALLLRSIFEPVPLYAILGKQGFHHHAVQHGDDDWQVWFYRPSGSDGPESGTDVADSPQRTPAGEDDGYPDGVVILDVRGLDPPEPLVRTLAALETLPPGATLVQINHRVPQFLLPQLGERGFEFEIKEQEPGLVRVFIRRGPDGRDPNTPN